MWERIFELLVAEAQRRAAGTSDAALVALAFDLLRVLTGLWWFNPAMLQFGLLEEAGVEVPALSAGAVQPEGCR